MSNERNVVAVIGGVTALIVLVILIVVWQRQEPQVNLNDIPDDSLPYTIQGRDHIPFGSPPRLYNSNPPTSGDHYASPVKAGFYERQLPDPHLIHNLEHGQIWLSWRDAQDRDAIDVVRYLQEKFPTWTVATWRPQNNQRVAAAAWGRLLSLDEPDRDALTAFIMRYRDKAPESVPG